MNGVAARVDRSTSVSRPSEGRGARLLHPPIGGPGRRMELYEAQLRVWEPLWRFSVEDKLRFASRSKIAAPG